MHPVIGRAFLIRSFIRSAAGFLINVFGGVGGCGCTNRGGNRDTNCEVWFGVAIVNRWNTLVSEFVWF